MNVRRLLDYAPRRLPGSPYTPPPRLAEENPPFLEALDLSHAGAEVLLDRAHGALPGMAAGAVALGAFAWGAAKLGSPSPLDRIEAAGSLALGASLALTAWETARGQGESLAGAALGGFHGLTDLGVGVYDLIHARRSRSAARTAAGLFQVARGALEVASHLAPQAAPGLHLAMVGAVVGRILSVHCER